MAVETVNYQCPACGGPLHFTGATGMVQCDYCDSSFTVEQVEQHYAQKQAKAEGKADEEKAREQERAAAEGREAQGDTVVSTGKAQAAAAAQAGLDPIQAYLKRSNWDDAESATLSSSVCSSCGAELVSDGTVAVYAESSAVFALYTYCTAAPLAALAVNVTFCPCTKESFGLTN